MQGSQLPSHFLMFLAGTGHTREAIWLRKHMDQDFRHCLTQKEKAKSIQRLIHPWNWMVQDIAQAKKISKMEN